MAMAHGWRSQDDFGVDECIIFGWHPCEIVTVSGYVQGTLDNTSAAFPCERMDVGIHPFFWRWSYFQGESGNFPLDRSLSIHPSIQSHDQGHGIKVHWTLIMAFMTRVCKGNSRISSHPNTWQARNSSDLGYTYRISPIYALINFTLISISLHQCWVGRRVLLNRFPPI